MSAARSLLLATAAVGAIAPPAIAREADSRTEAAARRLSDPATQAVAAAMIGAMADAILDMPIEPYVRAMRGAGADEAVADLPPDATMRDVAGPRAEAKLGAIREAVPGAMAQVGTMMGAMEKMLPELEATARRMKQALPAESPTD